MAEKKYSADDILKLFNKLNKKIEELTCFVKECCAKIPVNVGTGIGLFKKFNQNKWEFKSLLPGNNVTITETNNEVIISSGVQPVDCDDIKDCLGISPSGDPNKYLNEQGDWQTITIPSNFINSVSDTATIDLTVTGTTLSADFASMNISQFTNDSGYGTGTVTSVSSTVPVVTNPFLSVNVPSPTTTPSVNLTANGLVSQYVRGDGSLANFPISSGGGSSVVYYLNGGTNQGTFAGNIYYEMNKTAVIGLAANFTINSPGYIAQFITDAGDPSLLNIPVGNWNFETYFSASSSGGSPNFYVELYKYDGINFTLIASNSSSPEGITGGTVTDLYVSALAVPQTTLSVTDRLAVRIYVNNSGRTITLHTQDNTLCQITTTFTTGITALNGLTDQIQSFATGITGTDFGITSSGGTHTFNLPVASSLNTGKLSSADWLNFDTAYTNRITSLTTTGNSGAATLSSNTLNVPNYTLSGLGGVPTSRTLTINGTAQDLSADRTWSVGTVTSVSAGTGITVTGTAQAPVINTTNGVKFYSKITADSATTSSSSEVVLGSILIPANTVTTGDVVLINARGKKTGTSGSANPRIRINTSATVGGSIIYSITQVAANLGLYTNKTGIVKSGTNTEFGSLTVSNDLSAGSLTSSAVVSYSVDWTVDQYIIFSYSMNNALDTGALSYLSVTVN